MGIEGTGQDPDGPPSYTALSSEWQKMFATVQVLPLGLSTLRGLKLAFNRWVSKQNCGAEKELFVCLFVLLH